MRFTDAGRVRRYRVFGTVNHIAREWPMKFLYYVAFAAIAITLVGALA